MLPDMLAPSKLYFVLLDSSTTLIGGVGEAPAAAPAAEVGVAADAAANGAEATGFLGAIGPTTILLYAALLAMLWFFLLRPQRKREKALRDMQQAIKTGDNVVTSGGLYGVVTAIEEECFIVEFGINKGVRVPVRKTDIMGIKTPAKAKEVTE